MIFLLIIIYISFISLGLPDSLLGSAWPSMYEGFGVSIANAGYISMIISGGTIVSSLFSSKVIKKFGTGVTTFISVVMTAIALLGFSLSNSFLAVCFCALPLGLGAGSVDAALNNFIAGHYTAKHMNWLHGFWGLGASVGPIIIYFYLFTTNSWNHGYRTVSAIQFALAVILLFSLPLWRKVEKQKKMSSETPSNSFKFSKILRIKGVKRVLIIFFCYCSLEATTGLWGSSYLATTRGIPSQTAASWISLYYLGITLGRFLSGFLAIKLAPRQMVFIGQGIILVGLVLFFLHLDNNFLLIALLLVGFGCAPIFPSLLHDTPHNFGEEYSQEIMGLQMASAYTGTTLMPPILGYLGKFFGYEVFPIYLGFFLLIMILFTHLLYPKKTV